MSGREILQFATLIITIAGIACWIKRIYRNRISWLDSIPVLSVLLHYLVFYSVVFIHPPTAGETIYTYWSAARSLHTVIILAALAYQRRWR